MAAAAASLLTLTSLLLAVAIAGAVESYTDNPSSPPSTATATGGGGIAGPVDESSYNPARLCDNAASPESCVEVLPMIPGLADTPPDYNALAVLLDDHASTTIQAAASLAAGMRAAGATVDKCVASCAAAVDAANSVFAEVRPLTEVERLRRIHVSLAATFRDGGADTPPAYLSGCPEGSIRNAADGAVVARFSYVYAVLDLLEVVLAQVFSNDASVPAAPATAAAASGDENCTPPPPAAAAVKDAGYRGAKQ
uniref:Pectinesterase inhibitor domain-containing protein n=1 Tax=Leersia perrieri TaxID=77586 RepID=A0A0D9XR21_9ORYZ